MADFESGEDLAAQFPVLLSRLAGEPPDAVCYDAMTLAEKMAAMKPVQLHGRAAGVVEDLGLGRRLPAELLSPALIRTVVAQVRNDQDIRCNQAVMKQRVRGAGGLDAAADAIEDYLGVIPSRPFQRHGCFRQG